MLSLNYGRRQLGGFAGTYVINASGMLRRRRGWAAVVESRHGEKHTLGDRCVCKSLAQDLTGPWPQ